MKTVEACEHEEGGTIHARAEFEVHLAVGVRVFVTLHKQEHNAQQNGEPHELDGCLTFVFNQRVMRDRQSHLILQLPIACSKSLKSHRLAIILYFLRPMPKRFCQQLFRDA